MAPLAHLIGLDLLLDEARIFVDLALGLVLFDLGRRMDLQWMKRDWNARRRGPRESLLTFAAVFADADGVRLPAGAIGHRRLDRDGHLAAVIKADTNTALRFSRPTRGLARHA